MGEMSFDIRFDAGAGTLEAAEPEHLIADELVIGRVLERQEAFEKSVDIGRPDTAVVAATATRLIGFPVTQPRAAELIEASLANP